MRLKGVDMTTKIEPKENGPYLISGLKSLKNSKGTDLSSDKPVIALCRCGHSKNKPFCDGTHTKIGFISKTEKPSIGKWQDYVGKKIDTAADEVIEVKVPSIDDDDAVYLTNQELLKAAAEAT